MPACDQTSDTLISVHFVIFQNHEKSPNKLIITMNFRCLEPRRPKIDHLKSFKMQGKPPVNCTAPQGTRTPGGVLPVVGVGGVSGRGSGSGFPHTLLSLGHCPWTGPLGYSPPRPCKQEGLPVEGGPHPASPSEEQSPLRGALGSVNLGLDPSRGC